ncbi:hypothetical protein [Priestia aryabhattai]|uniref:hypothetical protein n=1 Tax=Priestia aryabhattai TaxID=412384 RepID=UPI002E1F7B1A|nr:hypothetical protein [Priestia aryabhattai]
MKVNKEKRSERLATNVRPSLKEQVLKFAHDNGDVTESKAVEMLIIKGLNR